METLYVYWGIFLNYFNNSYIFTAAVHKIEHIFSCNAKLLSEVFQKTFSLQQKLLNLPFTNSMKQ